MSPPPFERPQRGSGGLRGFRVPHHHCHLVIIVVIIVFVVVVIIVVFIIVFVVVIAVIFSPFELRNCAIGQREAETEPDTQYNFLYH